MNLIVIPARYQSTRFPGKPLAKIAGKTMIERVYSRVKNCRFADKIVVATEDQRIVDCVTGFGGESIMTSDTHETGTSRLTEVLRQFPQARNIINVQGDEPLVSSSAVDKLIQAMLDDNKVRMATLGYVLDSDIDNPNTVKIVLDQNSNAIYFSRSKIPFVRNPNDNYQFIGHVGLYGYSKDTLEQYNNLKISQIEQIESLEQLRFLFNGISIKVIIDDYRSYAVDIPSDVERFQLLTAFA